MSQSEKKFIGVYRMPSKPNQRLPIHQIGDSYVDILGNKVDISKMVKVS